MFQQKNLAIVIEEIHGKLATLGIPRSLCIQRKKRDPDSKPRASVFPFSQVVMSCL
jgi:hypothetical protein